MAKIAIPIERKIRELDGKVWLSMNLVNDGHKVILGKRHHLYDRIGDIEPDFILQFKASESSLSKFERWKDMGISIGVLETEGGVFGDKWEFLDRRCEQDSLDYVDIYFAWGNEQKNWLSTHREVQNIIVSGNPRFDLTREPLRKIYNNRSSKLNERYGDFILFNGNFAITNHGTNNLCRQKNRLKRRNYSQQEIKERISKEQKLFNSFLNAIIYLAECGLNVVVRPHQAENISTYRKKLNHNNICVELSGDVREWITASKAVVHNSCTTGIESMMLDTPTYSYEPINISKRPSLPNEVSKTVENKEALFDEISCEIDYKSTKQMHDLINRYFNRYASRTAAEIITSQISNEEYKLGKSKSNILFNSSMKSVIKDMPGSTLLKKAYYLYLKKEMNTNQRLYLSEEEVRKIASELETFIQKEIYIERIYKWDDIYQIESICSKNKHI